MIQLAYASIEKLVAEHSCGTANPDSWLQTSTSLPGGFFFLSFSLFLHFSSNFSRLAKGNINKPPILVKESSWTGIMASNSIFDTFATYSPTFLRGEYRAVFIFKAGNVCHWGAKLQPILITLLACLHLCLDCSQNRVYRKFPGVCMWTMLRVLHCCMPWWASGSSSQDLVWCVVPPVTFTPLGDHQAWHTVSHWPCILTNSNLPIVHCLVLGVAYFLLHFCFLSRALLTTKYALLWAGCLKTCTLNTQMKRKT